MLRLPWRRRRPKRPELIDRKHRMAGEITMLTAEVRRLRESGQPVADAERRLAELQRAHYQTRLEIDRAEF